MLKTITTESQEVSVANILCLRRYGIKSNGDLLLSLLNEQR
jgi:hypothetical protein